MRDAIQQGQAQLREATLYDAKAAVVEIDQAIRFGYKQKNPMSVAKLLELKAKLHGLLVDKVEVAAVDLRGAMEKANNRVLKIVNAAQIGDSGEGDSQTGSV